MQRHGKKDKPLCWTVTANSRTKRDGKFPKKLGTYSPISNPAQIEINVNAAARWLQNGAQPSDIARCVLSYKGVLLRHHLLGGVAKGALTTEQAEVRFNAQVETRNNKVSSKEEKLAKEKAVVRAKALDAEKEADERHKDKAAARAAEAATAATAAQAESETAAGQPQETGA